jgi:hypothetical protein|tara:strand:+ start:982 stop:1338 length:357 start_codon:yes stop_codon:yes gene_type:complete
MQDDFPYPEFISPLMKLWLKQYKADDMEKITKIGLFDWKFMPNKHKPEKPRRKPNLKNWETLIDSSFSISIYFFEVDKDTLHVFESSGIALGGLNIAHEYILQNNEFVQTKILMKMIR